MAVVSWLNALPVEILKNHEFQVIVDTLAQCNNSKKDAADKLGISFRSLRYRIDNLGIKA